MQHVAPVCQRQPILVRRWSDQRRIYFFLLSPLFNGAPLMGVAMHNDAGKCPEEPEKLISECDPLNFMPALFYRTV